MSGSRPVLLVVAKAPIPGMVKTRLTPPFTPHQAAALAAAALLDTLDACRSAGRLTGAAVVVALSGDLDKAMSGTAIRSGLAGVRVVPQRGDGLAARLAAAHADAAGDFGTTLQVGMDTPQLQPLVLAEGLGRLSSPDGPDAVLGLAEDGGWWALGLRRAGAARCLVDVTMSTAHTGVDTLSALRAEQRRIELLPTLRDVDTVSDVDALAQQADGRFGALARALRPMEEDVS
ncbi:MAG TPA: DUF2064 domain-containing protein [Propionicimonas sp.]|nr:DUF2064 domain-containing protein [Propionicimonas sp.]